MAGDKLRGDVRDDEFCEKVLAATEGKVGSVMAILDETLGPYAIELDVIANEVRCGEACFYDIKEFARARAAANN